MVAVFIGAAITATLAAPPDDPNAFRLGTYTLTKGPYEGSEGTRVVWLDGRGDLELGEWVHGVVRAPDGASVVFTDHDFGRLRFVDLRSRRMTWVPRLSRTEHSCITWVLQWRRIERLMAKWWCGDAHRTPETGFAMLDPVRKRVVNRRDDVHVSAQRVGDRLVLLLAPRERIGFVEVALVSHNGATQTVRTPIRVGSQDSRTFNRWPAVVIGGDRVFLAGEDDGIATVDLRTLAVRHYRVPLRHRSLRFASPWEPHRGTTNPSRDLIRYAEWLGDERLAIWGEDRFTAQRNDRLLLFGVHLFDVSTETLHVLDVDGVYARRIGHALLVKREGVPGYAAYTLDGRSLARRGQRLVNLRLAMSAVGRGD